MRKVSFAAMRKHEHLEVEPPQSQSAVSAGTRAGARTFPTHLLVLGFVACSLLFWGSFRSSGVRQVLAEEHHHQHDEHMDHHDHAMMGHMMDHGMDGGDMGDMAMPMYFMNTWHTTLWFKSWETTGPVSYTLSLLGLLLLGILHEAVAVYRSHYLSGGLVETAGMLQEPLVGVANPTRQKPRSAPSERLCAALLYGGNIMTGYLLMLAVMTFNTGYFFAVVVGMALGYYLLFDWGHKSTLTRNGDCCQPRPSGSM